MSSSSISKVSRGAACEDRRRKAPAARDVAGLIRSIDYSATAALERATQDRTR